MFRVIAIIAIGSLLCGCAANSARQVSTPTTPMLHENEIDTHVTGFADSFMSRVAFDYDQLIATAKTQQIRTWALQSRLGQANATLANACGPNPTANLLNMVV